MADLQKTYYLSPENIDLFSTAIYEFMLSQKIAETAASKARLSAITILLNWMNQAVGQRFEVETKKFLGRVHILLKLHGNKITKINDGEEEIDIYKMFPNNIETVFSFEYKDGYNIVDMKLPRPKVGSLGKIIIAIVSALAIGNLMNKCLSPEMTAALAKDYATPMIDAIIGILGAFASFMIFFSIVASITGMGNVSVLKNIGSKFFKQVLGSTLITTGVCLPICLIFFNVVSFDGGIGVNLFNKIYALIIDIIPTNIISPFTTGNTLQIVFLAIFGGTILLVLSKEVEAINNLVMQCNKFFQYAVRMICETMPVFIFFSFLKMSLSNSIGVAFGAWRIILVHTICYAIMMIAVVIHSCIYCKIPIIKHLKESIPLFVLGFSTGGTVTCLPQMGKILDSHKVDKTVTDFGLPIGLIISKRTLVIYYAVLVLGFCAMLGKTITLGQFVVLAISSLILGIATPSIPGGSLAIITMLMTQYGLPMETVGVALSLDFIDDMTSSATRSVCLLDDVLVLNKSLQKASES